MQILRYHLQIPEIKATDIFEYLCTDFTNSVMAAYKNHGSDLHYDDGQTKGSSFLLGYQDRLFKIDFDFHIGESLVDYYAIGSGEQIAYGALYVLDKLKMEPVEKVRRAIEASALFSIGVIEPIIIDST